MSSNDPITSLAVGLAADHKAEKQEKARKRKAAKAEPEGETEPEHEPEPTTEAGGEVVASSTEAPPAPGEDAEAVFQRRLDRLERLVDEAEFETGTAFGDLRDVMLDLFKHRPKVWSAMSAGEQQDTIRHLEAVAKRILSKVVLVIAEEDSVTIQATLVGQFNVKGEAIEAKIKIDHADEETLLDAYRLAGHRVVILSADDKRFMSSRREAEVQPDQLGMAFADGPADEKPTPPADDSDLNPDGDEDDTSGDDWGVFDQDGKRWLVDESGGDDGWTDAIGDAGQWTYDRAKELAEEYAAEEDLDTVARQIGGAEG